MTSFAFVNPLHAHIIYFEQERTRWPFWLPVALAMGVVTYFSLPFEPSWGVLIITPVLAVAAWFTRAFSWPLAIVLFVLTLISTGFSAAKIEALLDERPMLNQQLPVLPISGRVASTDIMPDGIRLTLIRPRIGDLAPETTPEKVRVKFSELAFEDAPPTGSEVSFVGQLNAFSEPVAPDATDFRRYAYYKHIGGLGWSRDVITIINPEPNDYSWSEKFSLSLERARKALARHVYERLPGDVATITAARLNGEQTAISSPVMDAMRTAGLAHLLATSGANVTVMGLLIYFPLRMLLALSPWLALRFPIKKWAAVAAIFSALAFTFLVGSQAATMRSMIMVALAMIAITVDRHINLLRLVMMSALLAMLFVPSATMGPSFQMSFAAVFCLVATGRNYSWNQEKSAFLIHPFFAPIGDIVRMSLIAIAATTPFSIYHFQTFNLYGFVSNTLAIPLTSFWIMPFTIMAYLTAPWGADGFFIDMAGIGNAATIRIATTVAAWPHSVFYWPAMPDGVLIAIVIGGLWLCLWRKKWRYFGLLPIVFGMLYPLYTAKPDFFVSPNGKAWAVVLDDGRLAVSNIKRERFAVEQWQERLGHVEIVDAKVLPPDNGQVLCDDAGCVYRRSKLIVAMPIVEAAALEDCARADIIIAPFTINKCEAKTIIDKGALDVHGAYVLYFDEEALRLVTSRKTKGARPWSVGWIGIKEKAGDTVPRF
ncbi:MAG: ComEC/Rec2 family competence protein [Bdellovibrionales bacterium]|jgi:competence protein ComEC